MYPQFLSHFFGCCWWGGILSQCHITLFCQLHITGKMCKAHLLVVWVKVCSLSPKSNHHVLKRFVECLLQAMEEDLHVRTLLYEKINWRQKMSKSVRTQSLTYWFSICREILRNDWLHHILCHNNCTDTSWRVGNNSFQTSTKYELVQWKALLLLKSAPGMWEEEESWWGYCYWWTAIIHSQFCPGS